MIHVRKEQAADFPAISAIHTAAFPTDVEARLVEALRQAGNLSFGLVAENEAGIVGHIAFSPVHIVGSTSLAPVAVLPPYQKLGIGSELVRSGLKGCSDLRVPFVVVLGEPAYYQRFGFAPAHHRSIGNEYGAREEFMLIELIPGSLASTGGGTAQYCKEFSLVG